MLKPKTAILGLSIAALIASAPVVRAQKVDTGIVQKGQDPYGREAGYDPYTAAHLKLDVLEAQIETLRKKMQLQASKKAYQTDEWDKHYQAVKKQIDDWDKFQDEYNIE